MGGRKYYYDHTWPKYGGENYTDRYDLASVDAFGLDPNCAIYAFAGKEVHLVERATYSYVSCRKGLRSWKLKEESIVSHPLDELAEIDGVVITRDIDPLVCNAERMQRMMTVTIHVPQDISEAKYLTAKGKYTQHYDVIERLVDQLQDRQCNTSFSAKKFYIKSTLGSVQLWSWKSFGNGKIISFEELGMKGIHSSVELLAFTEALMDCVKQRFNGGREYPNETIYVSRTQIEYDVDCTQELREW